MDPTHRHDWRRVGSRAASKIRQREGAVMLPPLFNLLLSVTCKSKKHTAKAVDFKFFLSFSNLFFVLSFSAVFDLLLPLLLQIVFSLSQFVRGSVSFSASGGGEAKGGRPRGCCWWPVMAAVEL